MRKKIIHRLAAGTCSVCMAYALFTQSMDAISEKGKASAASWTETVLPVVEEATSLPVATEPPAWSSTENASAFGGGSGKHIPYSEPPFGDDSAGIYDSSSDSSSSEDTAYDTSDNDDQDTTITATETDGGDNPPTLAQFLSLLRCGGCRHGCLLVSPRCMKGSSKAQTATAQYYAQYGS